MIEVKQFLWMMGWFLHVKADDLIVNRHYEKRITFLDNDSYLYGVSVHTTSLLRCTALCTNKKCDCMSHAYNATTNTCSLFSVALESQPPGDHVVYVEKAGCCSVPYVKNADGILNYTSNGTAFDYICDPDLYIPVGDPAMTCLWETGQWSTIQFQCKNGWKCVSPDLLQHIIALFPLWSYESICKYDGHRYTGRDDRLAPGCGGCRCCKRQ